MVLDREFPPDIRVENEIDALVSAGHTVHIACYTRKNKPEFEKTGKITVYRKPISSFIYKSSVASLTLPFYCRFWKKFLSRILESQSFDVIHVHDLPLVGLGVRLKNIFRVKLVADLHENWPAFLNISKHSTTFTGRIVSPIFLWRRFEKKVLTYSDAVIVVVDEARKRLVDLGIDAKKIFVVSNTINLDEMKPLPPESKHTGIILYYAGGINYHRGLQNVIKAMHKSENPNLKFMILGDGSYKNELEALVEKLAMSKQIIFCGYQPFTKVMEMLSEADYALIPHLKTEHTDSTIPHKLFQYMYLQKPVIASDCLPIKRIVEETGSGVIYPADDITYLGELLNQLGTLNYTGMAAGGKNAVIEKYNWNRDSEVLLNLYKEFISIQ
jgi:glycosyltransferase involved in cell wall biosynthesis